MNQTALKTVALICIMSLSVNLFSQNKAVEKKNYALLWEITGNGLTKPSYLFGTMHLRDKRVFEFTDSMFLKLESCDAFASEIRLDSAIYQSWELATSGDTTNRLSRKLSKTAYDRLLKAMKTKGINMDSLQSKNTVLVHDWLTEKKDDDENEDSKDLLLDLYLTRSAYNQGKSLYGLERFEDYEDLNDSFFKQFEDSTFFQRDTAFATIVAHFAMIEEMINVYNTGDLDNLQDIIRNEKAFGGNQYKRAILDNRNVRMIEKMEDIMHQKSVFCAVGAAHLPDSMGLIALLRQKGYSLRKVTPQFTGLAEQFKPKNVEKTTYHLKDDFNHLELDFPEQPYLMNKLKANNKRLGIQYLYYDVTTGAIMMAETDFYPHIGQKQTSKDQALNEVFTNWVISRGFKNIQKEKTMLGENAGYRFSARLKSKALVKGQFFLANNNVYKTLVFFDKHNETDTKRADNFINSLKINPLPLTDWQIFEEEKGAFTLKMPVKPDFQEVKSSIADENGETMNYQANLFVSKDAQEGFTYMVRYNDMPSGRFVENDSVYMSQLKEETLKRFKNLGAKIETDSLTRHYGCAELNYKITIEGINMLMRNILRGNRMYFLLAQPPLQKSKINNKKIEDWMNSFRFLPFGQTQISKKEFAFLDMNLGLPKAIEPYKLTEQKAVFPTKSETIIQTTDSQTGTAFVFTKTEYSKYYWAVNADSLWQKYVRTLKSTESKEVKVDIRDTVFKGLQAKLLTLDYTNTQNTFKSIVFVKDGVQYELSLVLPAEIASDAYANTYFDAIEFKENKAKQDIYSSKKQLVINDLASSIDSVRKEAQEALVETDWTKDDLPLLTDALQKKYPEDTLRSKNVRITLLNLITQFKDVSTFKVLENLVATTEQDSLLRSPVLCAFLELDTLNSANRFFEIAQSKGYIDFDKFYCLTTFMTDSVARAKLYYDKMLALSPKPFEENDILSVTSRLSSIDTLHLMRDMFVRYTPQYISAANALMTKNADMLKKDTLAEADYGAYRILSDYIRLFRNIPNTPEINQFLKKMMTTNHESMLSEVVQSLIKNGQSIEKNTWQRLQHDKSIWFDFLNELKYDSLLSIVPPQYINQKDIAEGSIRSYLEDEYGDPKEMTLLEIQKYKGEWLYIFKCKMDFDDEENDYLITITSQPLDKKKYDLDAHLFLISDPLQDVINYKKIVEEMLSDFEKRNADN